jgi:putative membrane-bound dehydrogenase-like protein
MAQPSSSPSADIHRSRLFFGICLALIPTGASFALMSNILTPLKQQFILTNYQVGLIAGAALWGMAISLLVAGPLLEAFGLKNGAILAFLGHVSGISLLLLAAGRVGDPSAFWMLMSGAATLAAGNGMIEVTGNPLVAALYPEEKTKRLNWFHAFFPIGLVLGGLAGFALTSWGGKFGAWPYQIGIIYLPILIYGVMVLPQKFPKTENAQMGIPVGEMFRYTLTNPLFLLMLAMMAITTSMELGPMRWIPSVLQSGGIHGILVLVWISGWMVVLRALAGHAVEKLQPTGMLLLASILTGSGLFLLAFAAATVFAWGVAFFFPTMVGVVSEKMPKTGSLGIVLTAGVGLGMAGAVGVPLQGKLADRYIAETIPASTTSLLQRVDQKFPEYITRAQATTDLASLGYTQREVEDALAATKTALAGTVNSDATANALRAIAGTAIPNEPLVVEAAGILTPAEAAGGQRAFRYIAPAALVLVVVFGAMFLADRRRGGYRAVKLEAATAASLLLLVLAPMSLDAQARGTASQRAGGSARPERMRVLFLGDEGHHRPSVRAKEILPVLAANGIDLYYTDNRDDLNDSELDRYHAVMLYNNHLTVTDPQIAALMGFVKDGGGLVVLHCASASFQNSEEFIRLVGAAFKSHGTGTFGAKRVAPEHPAIKGVPVWESWEETYIHTKHNPVDRTVLEVRSENGHDEPWTWVRTYGRGKVFYTAWGHDQRTWGQAGFQQMVGHALRWTTGLGGAATQQSQGVKFVDLDVPLPVYKRPPAPWNILDTNNLVRKAQVALPTPQSLQMMTLKPKFSVKPFAMEPMIGNIIDFTWDARGRMWAVETNDYPNVVLDDTVKGNDRILILEDTNGDGVADRTKVFADGMNLATSITFANGGVYVGQAPHMLFFKDTNGDDKADERKIVMTGFPRGDTHGAISNLRYGIDNQVWGSVGYNGYRGTVGPSTYGRGGVNFGSGYMRFPRDASDLEYYARTGNNTWGVALTEDNFVFGSTANSNPTNFVHIPLRYYRAAGMDQGAANRNQDPLAIASGSAGVTLLDIADKMDVYPVTDILQVDQFGRYTAGAGHEIYTARAFPKEYWNRVAFVSEPTAHLIGMFEISDNGSGMRSKNRWSFMASRDQWQAPVQAKVGPDGSVWVSDFYTLVAQHNPTPRMPGSNPQCCATGRGAAYETPNRDKLHGRIYRISYDSARASAPIRLDNATPAQLVRTLTNDNMFWRLTAQRLLIDRNKTDVVPDLIKLANDQTVDALGLNPGALHALWTLHGLGALTNNPDAMKAARNALSHPAASLRRAALMVLPRDGSLVDAAMTAGILPDRTSPWRVEYTVGTSILQDSDPHVRLEALLALTELPASPKAAGIAMEMLAAPDNARDIYMMDAIAMVGAKHGGPEFISTVAKRPVPRDSLATVATIRAINRMGRSIGAKKDLAAAVNLLGATPQATPQFGLALALGIAEGWPQDGPGQGRGGQPAGAPPQPPPTPTVTLTPEQKAVLVAAAKAASPELNAMFTRVAARWLLPNAFKE